MKRFVKSFVSCVLTLSMLLALLTTEAYAASAETILNNATLSPDYFLSEESNDYYPELFAGQDYQAFLGVSFLPEDADELIRSTIESQTNSSMSTYQKVKALYTYIIDITDYGYGGYGNYCSVYSVLVDHIGTCADYNYVMMAFLRYLGIDAALVSGQTHKASGGYTGHQWVEAYIGGTTYVFDPQIDDNIAGGGTIYYYRFCKTYSEVSDKYILEESVYYIYYASPYFQYVYYDYFEGASTLRELGLETLDAATEFGFEIEGAQISGWYYDIACTQPVNLDATIKKDTIIWAEFSVSPFTDVPISSYYADPVYWANYYGITSGTSDTTFSPFQTAERCQVVTFLWRAAGCPDVTEETENPFTDVNEDDYFYTAVLWAVQEGITTGTSDTTFSPYEKCERCQVVTFLYRAFGEPEVTDTTNPFTDVDTDDYFYNAVLWAVEEGVTSGTTATTFGPFVTCERCMIVTFLYRALAE